MRGAPGVTVVALVAAAASAGPGRADVLRVLAAGATESTIRAVAVDFERARGERLRIDFGGVGRLRDRIVSGEAADLVIATPVILDELQQQGLVRTSTRVDLGRVGGGVAVRAGEPRPRVGSADELRRALVAADEVYFPDPATTTAGAHLISVADRLGVGAAVRRKGRTAPGGKEAMQLLARSRGRAIGVTQISEILSVEGVALVGPYPAALQKTTTYSGAVLERAVRPDAAQELLRFLATPAVQARFRKAGFDAS